MISLRLIALGALCLPSAALGQLLATAEGPIAMGHHHLNVSDVEAHKRFWVEGMRAEMIAFGRIPVAKFPNGLVFLNAKAPTAGTRGSTVDHLGFRVPDARAAVARLKEAGYEIVTRGEVSGGRATADIFHSPTQDVDLAFVLGPDDVKIEIMEDSSLDRPIVNHHIHFASPEALAMRDWYVETFGAEPGRRGPFETADLPGVNLAFTIAAEPTAPTRGRALDHIGFEVADLEAFCRELEGRGVEFDVPFRDVPTAKLKIAFFTDPWGTYIELTEGLDRL